LHIRLRDFASNDVHTSERTYNSTEWDVETTKAVDCHCHEMPCSTYPLNF
jgi:hypothetical protein